ncbi:methyltransferase domain-containing protein [Undibacterium fentianense]|uniref:Methyltransferase domain-containing protein n=1 Tax=Undibacterium fentianense TaxID=2828728 RepID=A0A941E045_9BURK|nr:methyltransferase domain-containing protein [Undibacterium fentianense]MBR7800739.1 methyltransferase domain-containing protein [Undibacterium fentianense]
MLSAPIDMLQVRRLFATPKRLVEAQFLRREVAQRMAEKLDLVNIYPRRVLDAGCGSGEDLLRLAERYPQADQIGIDASLMQLHELRHHAKSVADITGIGGRLRHLLKPLIGQSHGAANSVQLIQGNFAQLPFATNSVDIVWSNLALHWHPQPDLVLQEWFRVIAREGLVMFSSFGPDTFIELKRAFQTVDMYPHCLPFVDMHDFGDMLVSAGFATPVMDVERITLKYQNVEKLLADVRALGGNPLQDRRRGLLGKGAYAKLSSALEMLRTADGLIPLSIEVVFGHAFKPVPTKLATGESIIRFDPSIRKAN